MHYKIVQNAFTKNTIQDIVDYYNNYFDDVHVTNGMYKIENPW